MTENLRPDEQSLLLEVKGLTKFFPIRSKGLRRKVIGQVQAVDDVSFKIFEGETLGLVGESGCGKTTTARCIMRALDPTLGEILFSQSDQKTVDIAALSHRQMFPLRRDIQMIFQDPYASLNPRMNILDIIGESLLVIGGMKDRAERSKRVAELLKLVGLRPEYMQRFPHAFSGGQRQRIVIARALALNPRLIVADEPVSALDVSVQAQVLNLMLKLQQELNLTYLFVAHDLSVVKHFCDRVAVMYLGKIVELASTTSLFEVPMHPYTKALMGAVPEADPRRKAAMVPLIGEVPSPANPPSGCHFHTRCPHATELCKTTMPTLEEIRPGQFVRCHRAAELAAV
jgi:peptide/nickel transport system ATP-binding protein